MIGSLGIGKIIVILVVLIVLFGAKKLPELGSGFGKAIKNFKKESKDIMDGLKGGTEK